MTSFELDKNLERNLLKVRSESEELMKNINDIMYSLNTSQITPERKQDFLTMFSKLAKDIASLHQTILASQVQDKVDLEAFAVAPDNLAYEMTCIHFSNFLLFFLVSLLVATNKERALLADKREEPILQEGKYAD